MAGATWRRMARLGVVFFALFMGLLLVLLPRRDFAQLYPRYKLI